MPQNEQQTPSAAPLGASLLVPLVGIPLALHALSGAFVASMTFAAGKAVLIKAKDELLKPAALPAKNTDSAEDIA